MNFLIFLHLLSIHCAQQPL